MNNIAKWTYFADDGDKNIVLDSHDGGEDDECNAIGFVEISELFEMHGWFFFGKKLYDRVQTKYRPIPCK